METKRISRRELLRRVGFAGAAAWSAPMLASSGAFASVDRCTKKKSRKLCRGTPGDCTHGFAGCGTCSSNVGDGSWCFERFGDLSTLCAEDVFCSEAGQCTSDADCKAQGLGNVCITNNGCTACDTKAGVCSTRCCTPLVGRAAPVSPRRLGKTAARR